MRTFAPAVAGLAASTLVLVPTAASAERWTHRDAAGDVVRATDDPEAGEGSTTPAPDDTATDVRRLAAVHGAHRLRVTVKVDDIVAGGKAAFFRIRTSDRRTYEAVRFRADGFSAFFLSRGRNGDPVKCSGKSLTIDNETDLVSLTLPRKCLANPRWVQVGSGYTTFSDHDGLAVHHADDALRNGMSEKNTGLRMSPRLSRS